jgi:hypothetical protein
MARSRRRLRLNDDWTGVHARPGRLRRLYAALHAENRLYTATDDTPDARSLAASVRTRRQASTAITLPCPLAASAPQRPTHH